MSALLEVEHVSVGFGPVSALSDVSLEIGEGEIVGLVGESGCGKSTLALAVMGLLPQTATLEGSIRFGGRELTRLTDSEQRGLRGDRISMVFQDPASALDPAFAVGEQVAETIRAHRDLGRREAKARAIALLREVGIPDAARRYGDPPHRFSGGMQQRVVIATALANEPALLIADEPTTALDVTIQAQIVDLMRELRRRHRTGILLIAHDLGVVAQLCDRAVVLYAGQVVESGSVEQLFGRVHHPYTTALLSALPSRSQPRGELATAPGRVPDLADPPPGCRFEPRCPLRRPACERVPPVVEAAPQHRLACWAADELGEQEATVLTGETV